MAVRIQYNPKSYGVYRKRFPRETHYVKLQARRPTQGEPPVGPAVVTFLRHPISNFRHNLGR